MEGLRWLSPWDAFDGITRSTAKSSNLRREVFEWRFVTRFFKLKRADAIEIG
jgi:hypothetical protein